MEAVFNPQAFSLLQSECHRIKIRWVELRRLSKRIADFVGGILFKIAGGAEIEVDNRTVFLVNDPIDEHTQESAARYVL